MEHNNNDEIEVIEVEVEDKQDFIEDIKRSGKNIFNKVKAEFQSFSENEKVKEVSEKIVDTSSKAINAIEEKANEIANDEKVKENIEKVKNSALSFTSKALDSLDKALNKKKG